MDKKWFVIYTKPNKEDLVASLLGQNLIEAFNPILKTYKVINSQKVPHYKPLFPCYIFGRFEVPREWEVVKYTWGVKRILGTSQGPIPIPDDVIAMIQSHMKDGYVEICSDNFRKGQRVRIIDGPFKGLEAIFIKELPDKERVYILLDAVFTHRVVIRRHLLKAVA